LLFENEKARESFEGLGLALNLLERMEAPEPELIWESLAPFLADAAGNTHRELGVAQAEGCRVRLRQALEPWPLVGDVASQEGGTTRLVDSSTTRLELSLRPPKAEPVSQAPAATSGRYLLFPLGIPNALSDRYATRCRNRGPSNTRAIAYRLLP
jgi:uncharacterized protein (DUF2126 family)